VCRLGDEIPGIAINDGQLPSGDLFVFADYSFCLEQKRTAATKSESRDKARKSLDRLGNGQRLSPRGPITENG
jgi:hypothetical protein